MGEDRHKLLTSYPHGDGLMVTCSELREKINRGGTSLVVQWLKLHAPNAGDPGSIPGQGIRSHMLPLKILSAATKTRCSQIHKLIN